MRLEEEPRTHADLAEHARDVQAAIHNERAEHPTALSVHVLAVQIEHLAAQLAETNERLALLAGEYDS